MAISSTSKAWMLGPKAENETEFEKLLLQVFRDYCYWRRNFHPEDAPWVTAEDRMDLGFQRHHVELQDRLFEMVSRLKRSVPFFSPRYLGHMNTDLLIPGILGYIGAMLYNQNNIVQEGGVITLQFESEALRLVAEMLGLPATSRWGHLCSGGTVANLESLWVARNLRLLPYQFAVALRSLDIADPRKAMLEALEAGGESLGGRLKARSLSSMTVGEILDLRTRIDNLCAMELDVAAAVDACSIEVLGLARFVALCKETLADAFPRFFRILLSRNAHYSLKKSANVIGLGRADLVFLPLDDHMRVSIDAFREAALDVYNGGGAILASVGVYGSTEEGSVDNFAALVEFREERRHKRLADFWIHGDACYGGYALSFMHPDCPPQQLSDFLTSVAATGQPLDIGSRWSDEHTQEWLRQAHALGVCDSISIDPHKLGYIPYPAGAVFYGDYRVREVIRVDAPYLNASLSDNSEGFVGEDPSIWDTPYLGKFTLEGSRPGAYAAATWLAHKTVALDRSGHGAIVGASLAATRILQQSLRQEMDARGDGLECHFLCEDPDLNILCYTFGGMVNGRRLSLSLVNRVLKRIYEELLPTESQPTQTRDFVVAMTSLGCGEYGDVLRRFVSRLGVAGSVFDPAEGKRHNPWRDDTEVAFIRTVVMGPFLLGAETKARATDTPIQLAGAYARFLRHRVAALAEEERDKGLLPDRRQRLDQNVLVLEDDLVTRRDIYEQISHIGFDGEGSVFTAANESDARRICNAERISAAMVDIQIEANMRGGIDFLQSMTGRQGFRGAVVFTGVPELRSEVEALATNGGWKLAFHQKPSRTDGHFQATANEVMESLWEILYG